MNPLERLAALAPKPPAAARTGNGGSHRNGHAPVTERGDYSTVDLVAYLQHHGLYGHPTGKGWHTGKCANGAAHSTPDEADDTDTIYYEGDGVSLWPQVKCQHAHCVDLKIQQVFEMLGDPTPFCARRLESRVWPAGSANGNGKHTPEAPGRSEESPGDPDEPGPAFGQAAQEEMLAKVAETADLAIVFGAVAAFAGLPITEWAVLKGRLKKALGKALNLNDLEKAVAEAKRMRARARAQAHARNFIQKEQGCRSDLPSVIVSDRPLHEMADEALVSLAVANEPPITFSRAGELVKIKTDEKGRVKVAAYSEAALRGRMARSAYYKIETQAKEGLVQKDVSPPLDVVRDLLARDTWPFPALEGITEVPVLRPDGSLLKEPGYDAATGLYYAPPPGFELPPVPSQPTQQEITTAADLLQEIFEGFPFVLDAQELPGFSASKANCLALLFTPAVRMLCSGGVPIALIDKPKHGSGGSKIAEAVARIYTGRPCDVVTAPTDEREWKSTLTAILREGPAFVSFDNIRITLDSPALAAALTGESYQGRDLGFARMLTVPQRATWVANGLNLTVSEELSRRSYRIRLDAKHWQPWRRTGFKQDDLLGWVDENRARILAAILTIAAGWVADGRPGASVPPIGNFGAWARIVGSILAYAGVVGFLDNLDQQHDELSEQSGQWAAFLAQIWAIQEKFLPAGFLIGDLIPALSGGGNLRGFLPDELLSDLDKGPGSLKKSLGWAFRKQVDSRHGEDEFYLKRDRDNHLKLWRYCVVRGSSEKTRGFSEDVRGFSEEDAGFSQEEEGPGRHGSGVCGVFSQSLSECEEDTPTPLTGTLQGGWVPMGTETEDVSAKPRNPADSESAPSDAPACWLCGQLMGDEDGVAHRGCEIADDDLVPGAFR